MSGVQADSELLGCQISDLGVVKQKSRLDGANQRHGSQCPKGYL